MLFLLAYIYIYIYSFKIKISILNLLERYVLDYMLVLIATLSSLKFFFIFINIFIELKYIIPNSYSYALFVYDDDDEGLFWSSIFRFVQIIRKKKKKICMAIFCYRFLSTKLRSKNLAVGVYFCDCV